MRQRKRKNLKNLCACVNVCVSLFFFRTSRKLAKTKTMRNASKNAFFICFDALLNLARQIFLCTGQFDALPCLLPLSPAPLPVAYCELCNASGNDISRQCDLIASPAAAAAASAFALKVSKTP